MKNLMRVIFMLFFGVCFFAYGNYSYDSNEDGSPDQWYNTMGSKVLSFESDRNFDGTIDQKTDYDGYDNVVYEEYDFNFDGVMDVFYYYDKGILARQEIDSNFDTSIDIYVYIYKGIYIRRVERDLDHDGEIDHVKNYSNF